MMNEIKEYIKKLIEQKLGVTLNNVIDYYTDLYQLGADDLDVVETLSDIEKHYGILLKENCVEALSVNTLSYLVDLEKPS